MELKKHRYDLAGEYLLCLDEKPCKYELPPTEFQMTMQLPGTTAQQEIGTYNTARETGFFTEKYPFEGQIWLRREIELTEEQLGKPYCFLTLERTRMTSLWVNGVRIGSENSLCTPHVYDLSGYLAKKMELVICVKNTEYPTRGGHMTSPDTQTNWIGITGELSLSFHRDVWLGGLKAYPNAGEKKVTLTGRLYGAEQCKARMALWYRGKKQEDIEQELIASGDTGLFRINHSLPEDVPFWSEHSPECIRLELLLANGESAEVCFGLRDFQACGDHFEINGHRTMLRGKHDGMVFPLIGAAPTDEASWEKVFLTVKAWGINHYRFHTCCPPEAAFTAADRVGIYLEPELPFWGTIDAPGGERYDGAEQAYLIREGLRICEAFGNHPSFCMLSLGNELWGNPEHIGGILDTLRKADPRPLYTQGSNNFQFAPVQLPKEDFWTGVRTGIGRLIRGSYADCDKPLGRIQTNAPSTDWNYEEYLAPMAEKREEKAVPGASEGTGEIEIQFGTGVKKVKASAQEAVFVPTIPAVTHEIGQYNVYPDYKEIEGYTGVQEARSFEVFRERLEAAGLLDQAEVFFQSSGAFSRDLYKMELEAAMRSGHLAGFQILDLQDFPGQGTALVGMLNARLENKGFISPEEWKAFCGDLVPLALFDSFVWESGKRQKVTLAIRSNRPALAPQKARITYECGEQSACFELDIPENVSGYLELGEWEILPTQLGKARLVMELQKERIRNEWNITVLPKGDLQELLPMEDDIKKVADNAYVTRSVQEAIPHLQKGERVLLLPGKLGQDKSIQGFYCTDFWNYHMFNGISVSMGRQVPVGTMGLCLDVGHEIIKAMYGEHYSTPQWYEPVTHCDCAILDDMPAGYHPIVQMIDNVDRNHRLGIVYEAKTEGGSLLVCTVRFEERPQDPAMCRLYQAILEYLTSASFAPKTEATWKQLGLV